MKAGTRVRCPVCPAELIVVRAPQEDPVFECGGARMVTDPDSQDPTLTHVASDPGTQLGKRYVSESAGVELMCVKAGSGQISADGDVLALGRPRHLPSSD